MSDFPDNQRLRRSFTVGILLLTFFALGLRLFRLGNQSFWVDEVSSILTAQGPLKGIYERSALAANSLPTFFLLLKPFVSGASTDLEFRARLLSVIAGTLSVPLFVGVVYFWRRKVVTALLAGLLLAVNPLHLWYSQEVRGYALMLMAGLAALLCFERARARKNAGWWALYTLSAGLALAVHRTGILFPAAAGLWHAWEVVKRRESWKGLLFHVPIAAATLAALAVHSYPPPEGYSRSASGLEIGYAFMTFVGGYSFGPSVTDIQSVGPLAAISHHALQTAMLGLLLLALAWVCVRNFPRLISGKEIQLLFLGIGVVSVYALLSGFPFNVRYALPALLGFLALAAVVATQSSPAPLARVFVCALVAVSLWADGQWFYRWDYRKGDSRAVAAWLVQHRDHVHSWMVLPDYMNVPVAWYLKNEPPLLAGEIPPTGDRSTTFPSVPDVLLITRRHHLQNPEQVIAAYTSAAHGVTTNRAFAGFEVYQGGDGATDAK